MDPTAQSNTAGRPWLRVVLALVLGGCVGPADPPVEVEAEGCIIAGEIDEDDVAVVALTPGGGPFAFCSGTLIAPSTVLTAAHCVPPHNESIEQAEDIVVFFGTDVYDLAETRDVVGAWVHPEFGTNGLAHDVALLRLERPGPVNPIPPALGSPPRDSEVRVVGYGITEVGLGGVRRSGTASVTWVGDGELVLTAAPSNTCFGDSGGPSIATIDGREYVVGVHSHLLGECGEMSVDTRVDTYLDGIRAVVLEPAPTCATDGTCVEGCTPPDVDCPCRADGHCSPDCPIPRDDPDCLASCERNGACNEGCAGTDPDCPCSADGLCDARCRRDPDCPPPVEPCAEDGVCDPTCVHDTDCPGLNVEGGGCSVHGRPSLTWLRVLVP